MLTKITLTIDGQERELGPDCLKNWGEVMCTYKRTDFSGVVRQFTSKFEFVNEAYDMLLAAYLSKGFSADAKVAIYVIDNDWVYHKHFECPLDFTSTAIESGVFSISAVDNSLSALIKANKSTKYEFNIGEDIETDSVLHFDRLPVRESVTYAFSDGTSDEETGALDVLHPSNQEAIWMGTIADEVCINQAIFWNEDQEDDEDSFALQATKAIDVMLDYEAIADTLGSKNSSGIFLYVQHINRNGSEVKDSVLVGSFGADSPSHLFIGRCDTSSDLPILSGGTGDAGKYAIVGDVVYEATYRGVNTLFWVNTGKTEYEYCQKKYNGSHVFHMVIGDKLRFRASEKGARGDASFRIVKSSYQFSWIARGEACEIPSFKPLTVLDAILERIGAGKLNLVGEIDTTDERLQRTYLLAAENIRGLKDAKLYTTFNEFCDWMSAVFGYTYYIGETWKSSLINTTVKEAAGFITNRYVSDAYLSQVPEAEWVYFNTSYGKFMVAHNGYYYQWQGDQEYNDPDRGKPYTDRLYKIAGKFYYFKRGNSNPIEFKGQPENVTNDFQKVVFVHRSRLFKPDANVKVIDYAVEARYSVNHSAIYSTVEIGYDKQDYDSINGRDEFNFSHTYSTGCSLSDKKLSLISKYRADCYGVEFAAQKRGHDTTDSKADKDVFFVLCESAGHDVYVDRTYNIEGALSDAVFNGGFSPIHCVRANAGYIGLQADELTLSFASSKGNSSIIVNGESMSSDLTLDTPLLTLGELEFTTGDLDTPQTDDLVEVEIMGIKYRGYIKEVEEKYGREASVKYTLLVKSIEL